MNGGVTAERQKVKTDRTKRRSIIDRRLFLRSGVIICNNVISSLFIPLL